MIWTDEAVEDLKKMWDRGMTTGQIAKVLNVTKNSIIGKVHRLCLTARPSPIKRTSDKSETKAKQNTKEAKTENITKVETKEKEVQHTSEPKTKKCGTKCAKESHAEEKKPAAPQKITEEINIPLIKLDNHTCRWPIGDPRDEDFCFCGKKVRAGQTYCDEHSAVAYVKPNKK